MPREPVFRALLTRSERVILFSGREVIVLIPFRGELGLGAAEAQQVELVDADDDGDQGDAQDGHVGVGAQQEAQEVEGHELLGEHQAAEHGEAHGGKDVGGDAATIDDKGRDKVKQALDGIGTQVEGAAAQKEILQAAPKANAPVHCIDTLQISLKRKLIRHIDEHREKSVGDIADRQREHGDGHGKGDGRLRTLAELNRESAGEHAANRLVRRHVGADGDRAHEQQLQACTHGKTGLQIPQHQAHERAQDDGAERIERTELVVELTKCGDKSDEDCLGKHTSPFPYRTLRRDGALRN